MDQSKPCCIPQLIDKMAIALHPFRRHSDIPSLGCKGCQGKTKSIGTVGVNHLQRVNDIALGFAHFLAVLIPYQGMDIDILERYISHETGAHHHHTCHPEEENIKAGDQGTGGIESFEKLGIFGPSHGRKWPQGTAEPGIQHITLLDNVTGIAQAALFRIHLFNHNLIALGTFPYRNPVSPPDLAGDAPVLNIV